MCSRCVHFKSENWTGLDSDPLWTMSKNKAYGRKALLICLNKIHNFR